MFYISEIQKTAPAEYKTDLQRTVYETLAKLNIPFERVDTDDAITMDDCVLIDRKLDMKTVKTLFLCNRQQTEFYLFITNAEKPFRTKEFAAALGVSRLSFAPAELMQERLGTKVGAATVFGTLLDTKREMRVIFDKDIISQEWYGCSDGTTTGYMKIGMRYILNDFLDHTGHRPDIITCEWSLL